MRVGTPKSGEALRGKTILLSASVPTEGRSERYSRVGDAAFEIEQAVISLARAVFSEGGRLVFGGHPAISPLVAMVVGEYRQPRFAESIEERGLSPVEIFFEGYLPDDTVLMYKLGYASIHWVDAVDHKRFEAGRNTTEVACAKSLTQMRKEMLRVSRPDAMVCIGGMEGLEEEVELALGQPRTLPLFVLERTGGAAALLGTRKDHRLRLIDSEIIANLDQMRAEMGRVEQSAEARSRRALVPYPLVMQTIVEEVSRGR